MRQRPYRTALRLSPAEKTELKRLARKNNTSESSVLRAGIDLVKRHGMDAYLKKEAKSNGDE